MKSFHEFYKEQHALVGEGLLGKIASIPGGILRTAGRILHAPNRFGAALSRFARTGEVGSADDYDKYRRKEFDKKTKTKKEPKVNPYKMNKSPGSNTIKRPILQPAVKPTK